jgi:hypothetical protein
MRWALFGVALTGSAVVVALAPENRSSLLGISAWLWVTAAVGFVLAGRIPRNPIGWLLLAAPALLGVHLAATNYALEGWRAGDLSAPLSAAAWLASWLPIPSFGLLGFVLLLFPSGSLPSRRWRVVAVLAAAGLALGSASLAFRPGPIEGVGLVNPVGWSGGRQVLATLGTGAQTVTMLCGIGAITSLVVRYRRSAGDERQQLRWLAAAGALLAGCGLFALFAEGALNEASFVVGLLGLTFLPVAIGVAVLRYRLYDLGLLVNRAIVYGALSVTVTVLYVGTVVGVGTAFDRAGGLVASLLATLLAAAGIQPLRRRIQHLVDRVMYGEQRDPYSVLTGLTRRLQATPDPAVVPELLVSTLVGTLDLPYAAVEMDLPDGALTVAEQGDRPDRPDEVPLHYQGEVVGRLLHAPPPVARDEPPGTS